MAPQLHGSIAAWVSPPEERDPIGRLGWGVGGGGGAGSGESGELEEGGEGRRGGSNRVLANRRGSRLHIFCGEPESWSIALVDLGCRPGRLLRTTVGSASSRDRQAPEAGFL